MVQVEQYGFSVNVIGCCCCCCALEFFFSFFLQLFVVRFKCAHKNRKGMAYKIKGFRISFKSNDQNSFFFRCIEHLFLFYSVSRWFCTKICLIFQMFLGYCLADFTLCKWLLLCSCLFSLLPISTLNDSRTPLIHMHLNNGAVAETLYIFFSFLKLNFWCAVLILEFMNCSFFFRFDLYRGDQFVHKMHSFYERKHKRNAIILYL